MSFKDAIDSTRLPQHIAIIMDGNGRWAKKRGKQRVFGHMNGVKSVRMVTETCARLGVSHLTLYAFSTENWGRPKAEVSALMELLVRSLRKETKELDKNDIRLNAIGNLNALPKRVHNALLDAIDLTKNNQRMTLTLALSYSSRWEITQAIQKIVADVQNNQLDQTQIEESTIDQYLTTKNIPDPELMIRTSGECRISNFLLWQMAYTELYFCDKFWPEFDKEDLYQAIVSYQRRDRRFGKL